MEERRFLDILLGVLLGSGVVEASSSSLSESEISAAGRNSSSSWSLLLLPKNLSCCLIRFKVKIELFLRKREVEGASSRTSGSLPSLLLMYSGFRITEGTTEDFRPLLVGVSILSSLVSVAFKAGTRVLRIMP